MKRSSRVRCVNVFTLKRVDVLFRKILTILKLDIERSLSVGASVSSECKALEEVYEDVIGWKGI